MTNIIISKNINYFSSVILYINYLNKTVNCNFFSYTFFKIDIF